MANASTPERDRGHPTPLLVPLRSDLEGNGFGLWTRFAVPYRVAASIRARAGAEATTSCREAVRVALRRNGGGSAVTVQGLSAL